MGRAGGFRLSCAMAAIVLAVGGTACSGDDDARAAPTSTTAAADEGAPSEETAAVPDDLPPREVLRRLALTEADVPGAATVELVPGGDRVENQVTLDLCGAEFPSEAHRIARHQVAVRDGSGERLVGDEGVIYRTEAHAAQALAEVRAAVAGCDPNAFVESAVAGVPLLRFDLELVTQGITGLTADHVALTAVVTAEDGTSMGLAAVYLRQGPIVVGLYGTSVDDLRDPAALITRRLSALDGAARSN